MVLKPVVMMVIAAIALAQAIPGCGEGQSAVVIGWVDRKYTEPATDGPGGTIWYMLDINYRPYNVPKVFWEQVDVGDKVMWDGKKWVIVQKVKK